MALNHFIEEGQRIEVPLLSPIKEGFRSPRKRYIEYGTHGKASHDKCGIKESLGTLTCSKSIV